MRCYIHSRTFNSVLRLPKEEEIYVGCHECYRYVGDSALLHNVGCDKFWSRNELSSNTESTTGDSDSETYSEFAKTSMFIAYSSSMCRRHRLPLLYLFLSNYPIWNSNFLFGARGRRSTVLQHSRIILVHLCHAYDCRVSTIYLCHYSSVFEVSKSMFKC